MIAEIGPFDPLNDLPQRRFGVGRCIRPADNFAAGEGIGNTKIEAHPHLVETLQQQHMHGFDKVTLCREFVGGHARGLVDAASGNPSAVRVIVPSRPTCQAERRQHVTDEVGQHTGAGNHGDPQKNAHEIGTQKIRRFHFFRLYRGELGLQIQRSGEVACCTRNVGGRLRRQRLDAAERNQDGGEGALLSRHPTAQTDGCDATDRRDRETEPCACHHAAGALWVADGSACSGDESAIRITRRGYGPAGFRRRDTIIRVHPAA